MSHINALYHCSFNPDYCIINFSDKRSFELKVWAVASSKTIIWNSENTCSYTRQIDVVLSHQDESLSAMAAILIVSMKSYFTGRKIFSFRLARWLNGNFFQALQNIKIYLRQVYFTGSCQLLILLYCLIIYCRYNDDTWCMCWIVVLCTCSIVHDT